MHNCTISPLYLALARDPTPALRRIERFVRPPSGDGGGGAADLDLDAAHALFGGHARSFGGAKLSAHERAHRLAEVGDAAREELELFGYDPDAYGVALECDDARFCGVAPG